MKPIDQKISAFVKRYVKPISPEEMEAAAERNLRRLMATVEGMKEAEGVERLKPFEYFVLTAAYLLRGKGYGINILDKVQEMSGQEANLGSVYVALSALEDRGLLESRLGDPTPERGGRPKRLYTATAEGEQSLAHAREYLEAASDFLQEST